jgi:hypothetical protein
VPTSPFPKPEIMPYKKTYTMSLQQLWFWLTESTVIMLGTVKCRAFFRSVVIYRLAYKFNLWSMRDINPKVANDSQGTFRLICLFLHLLILCAVFHTFLKIKTWNKKYTFKNASIYPFRKFEENLPIFIKFSWGSFFILLIFHSKFHFLGLFFSNSSCCEWRPCATKFGGGCTYHHMFSDAV